MCIRDRHDTHYNPEFWGIKKSEENFSDKKKVEVTMGRVLDYATHQYTSVINYMKSIGVHKPVHIGETGWATTSNEHYGHQGSKATDEYKSALYYTLIKEWSNKNKVSCFYFEAFDEQWKDSANPMGSENHFGLITPVSYTHLDVYKRQGLFLSSVHRRHDIQIC